VGHGRTAFVMKVCGKFGIQLALKRYHNAAVVWNNSDIQSVRSLTCLCL